MREFEIVLPKRVVPQPRPRIYKGGDCSACVLAGLIGYTVEEIYTEVYEQDLDQPKPLCWPEMALRLNRLYYKKELDRLIDSIPIWPTDDAMRSFGDGFAAQGHRWFKYVTMALDAGYYGIMMYNLQGDLSQMPNHFVLVCGARVRGRKIRNKAAWEMESQLLISCSSRRTADKAFWVALNDLAAKHGGFNILLARPRS